MTPNEQLIHQFYTAFQQKDYAQMQAYYAEEAKFSDAVFVGLNAVEVRAMWEMLCKTGKDLELTFDNVKGSETGGSAEWTAIYTFSKTGKRVKNHIQATFEIENGKITKHTDHFNLYAWARQAFGLTGWIIGWTDVFKAKIQSIARGNLRKFMANEQATT